MLKKIFISAVLLIAVLSFVVSLLGGNNNDEPKVAVGDRVAVINISGPIVDGASVEQTLLGGTQAATSGQLMKEIRDAAADSSVKALVLHINSPGGSVTAAEEVGRELERFKETTKKPIVTSMGDQAASAAYWLASYSDVIYANSSTLTGSIGVYMPYMNVEDLYKKIGVYTGKIKSGPHKDILSPDREMTAEEREILQGIVNQLYDEFIAVVANGRKIGYIFIMGFLYKKSFWGQYWWPVPVCLVRKPSRKARCCAKLAGDQWSPLHSLYSKVNVF